MTEIDQKQLGNTLWGIADQLRGAMNADDFRDYMLSFLFLRYLSDNYEMAAAKELGPDYPRLEAGDRRTPLALWYAQNPEDIDAFETSQDPATGKKKQLDSVLDFACGSGSLLLNVRHRMGADPAKAPQFDAVVANPPFSYRWEPNSALSEDMRFKNYGLAPKSAADFAFLLHGFHFLKPEGVMAIILPHGVLFRGGAEERIRTKLLKDGNIDTVIGLPANLFFSTGIPVCILVLKKCKKPDDVLFINAAEHFEKGKRQNRLRPEDIDKIIETYQFRREEERYARRVPMTEIADNDYNLNISRYISTATPEEEIDLQAVHQQLTTLEDQIAEATQRNNAFLQELGLPLLGSH
ncbi:type I restriction-modification system subunit M [Acidithiobacillus thiooxidans]|uniref:type I restriction-modification system subunit M n=1 Tax=Acidithiobacillus thiooxidans TaxID=930 RepID=UPI001C078DA8|nr:type I restriction-modification system subunit M [Acidithiobacillus thiooxidans]MBU2841375.1 N-6 DNA methylase [Acidithiobacillus thiooxidans]